MCGVSKTNIIIRKKLQCSLHCQLAIPLIPLRHVNFHPQTCDISNAGYVKGKVAFVDYPLLMNQFQL